MFVIHVLQICEGKIFIYIFVEVDLNHILSITYTEIIIVSIIFYRFSNTMPIYINMVRDPIEKAISWFYYIRSAPYLNNVRRKIDPNEPPPDVKWLDKVKYWIFDIFLS